LVPYVIWTDLPIFPSPSTFPIKILFVYFILLFLFSIGSLCISLMHCLPCNSILKSTWKFCKIWKEIWSDLALWGVWILLGRYRFITTK
jgi:hypothetical protein